MYNNFDDAFNTEDFKGLNKLESFFADMIVLNKDFFTEMSLESNLKELFLYIDQLLVEPVLLANSLNRLEKLTLDLDTD